MHTPRRNRGYSEWNDSIGLSVAGRFGPRLSRLSATFHNALHPRYAIAYGLSRFVPLFGAGALVAHLYRRAGFRVGNGCSFAGPVRITCGTSYGDNLRVGDSVLIANDVTLNIDAPLVIGDNATIGPYVRVYTGTHAIGPGSRRMMSQVTGKPVTIGKGSWIGLGVIVLPGVTIGDGCVIGAGSVVATDIESHTYAEGNPAVVVRSLPWSNR